jgi:GTP-binding protein
MRIVETTLISSAGSLKKLPETTLPEVAFAGRSNVGKSSLLNALANRRSLFKVSKAPGRTRTIVHVRARLDTGAEIYLVDLPGFGFAKVSKGMSASWGHLIEGYLSARETLHLVAVLMDVRRGVQEEERSLIEFLVESRVPALLVATKLDRVPKSKQKGLLDKMKRETGVDIIGTSSTLKTGVDRLLITLAKACGYTSPPAP